LLYNLFSNWFLLDLVYIISLKCFGSLLVIMKFNQNWYLGCNTVSVLKELIDFWNSSGWFIFSSVSYLIPEWNKRQKQRIKVFLVCISLRPLPFPILQPTFCHTCPSFSGWAKSERTFINCRRRRRRRSDNEDASAISFGIRNINGGISFNLPRPSELRTRNPLGSSSNKSRRRLCGFALKRHSSAT